MQSQQQLDQLQRSEIDLDRHLMNESQVDPLNHRSTTLRKPFGMLKGQRNSTTIWAGKNPIGMEPFRFEESKYIDQQGSYDSRNFSVLLGTGFEQAEDFRASVSSLVISTSSWQFQLWKMFIIFMSFASSFDYAHQATFDQSDGQMAQEENFLGNLFYDIVFAIDIITKLFTEHRSVTSEEVVRDVSQIIRIYCSCEFRVDLLAIFPFVMLSEAIFGLEHKYSKMFYYLKLVRLITGLKMLNQKSFMNFLKASLQAKASQMEEEDNELSSKDTRKFSLLLFVSLFLKTLQIIGFLLCGSYLTAMAWHTFCGLTSDFGKSEESNFIKYYGLNEQDVRTQYIALTYFAFTSLSTVGLGDFHPVSNSERLFGAFILLFGVAMTSYTMEYLNSMLVKMKEYDKDHEENSKLSSFLGTLQRFNNDVKIKESIENQILSFFDYRWRKNRIFSLSTETDLLLFDQLPNEVRVKLSSDFLFKHFLTAYSRYFHFMYKDSTFDARTSVRFKEFESQSQSQQNKVVRNMTLQGLSDNQLDLHQRLIWLLEPQMLPQNSVFLRLGKEASQMFFPMSGMVHVGYNHELLMIRNKLTMNVAVKESTETHRRYRIFKAAVRTFQIVKGPSSPKKATEAAEPQASRFQYVLKRRPGQAVGMFELLFQQHSHFSYKTDEDSHSDCFFIRTTRWRKFEKDSTNPLLPQLKHAVLKDYLERLYLPMMQHQKKETDAARREKRDKIRAKHKSRFNVQPTLREGLASVKNNHLQLPKVMDVPMPSSDRRLSSPDRLIRTSDKLSQDVIDQEQGCEAGNLNLTSLTDEDDTSSHIQAFLGTSLEQKMRSQETYLLQLINWKQLIQDPVLLKISEEYEQKKITKQESFVSSEEESEESTEDLISEKVEFLGKKLGDKILESQELRELLEDQAEEMSKLRKALHSQESKYQDLLATTTQDKAELKFQITKLEDKISSLQKALFTRINTKKQLSESESSDSKGEDEIPAAAENKLKPTNSVINHSKLTPNGTTSGPALVEPSRISNAAPNSSTQLQIPATKEFLKPMGSDEHLRLNLPGTNNFPASPKVQTQQICFDTPASVVHQSIASFGPSECASVQQSGRRKQSFTSHASSQHSSFFKPSGMLVKKKQDFQKSKLGLTIPSQELQDLASASVSGENYMNEASSSDGDQSDFGRSDPLPHKSPSRQKELSEDPNASSTSVVSSVKKYLTPQSNKERANKSPYFKGNLDSLESVQSSEDGSIEEDIPIEEGTTLHKDEEIEEEEQLVLVKTRRSRSFTQLPSPDIM